MVKEPLADVTYQIRKFLREHPVIRWFIVPILFMAGLIVGMMIAFGGTPLETVQIVIIYVIASLVAVVFGLAIEHAIKFVTG